MRCERDPFATLVTAGSAQILPFLSAQSIPDSGHRGTAGGSDGLARIDRHSCFVGKGRFRVSIRHDPATWIVSRLGLRRQPIAVRLTAFRP